MIRYLLSFLILAAPLYADVNITGQRVTVETDRYKVVVDGLTITEIHNKLTGETYAAPSTNAVTVGVNQLLADRGVAIESLRPAVPVKRFGLGAKTKLTARKSGNGATMTYTGLQCGDEFAEKMTITLALQVDRKTGDLLITPTVKGNIEMVHGVRDRGVLRNSFHVLNLTKDLKMIVPSSDGSAFTWTNSTPDWSTYVVRWVWPMFWEAGLFIAESPKGCLGIWADEPQLKYGRELSLSKGGDNWNLGFQFETSDVIYRCDEIKNATWRLNVYAGYWAKAAEQYQQQVMIGQWHMKPLAEQQPAWANKVRVILGSSMPPVSNTEELAKIFPRDSMVVFTSQGWLQGWNNGDMMKRAENYHPNYPLDNPVRWEGVPEFAAQAKALEAVGVHVFPYTNLNQIDTTKNPWIRDKIGDRHFWAWKMWQRFYPELCLDIVKRYGVSAIYEDCSWVLGRHSGGEPDGDNWYNGCVHMHEYFRELMPDIALMGERNNEVTARGMQFALGYVGTSPNNHPICSYLFDPFIHMFNLADVTMPYQTFDVDDIRGYCITVIDPYNFKNVLQEDRMILTRAQVFAEQQLNSYWPPTWDANVMHYFKGKDGTEYRFVRDHGTRFIKLTTNGVPETIYWRASGVENVVAPGSGVEGWVGYDGDRLIGLNPVAQYVVIANVARPPALITKLPDKIAIDRTIVRDGFWTVHLDTLDRIKAVPAPDAPIDNPPQTPQVLRVHAGVPVTFLGVDSAVEKGGGDYEVTVKLPGSFSVAWAKPTAVVAVPAYVGELPAKVTHQRIANGVVCVRADALINRGMIQHNPGASMSAEGAIVWLVTLPATPVRLAFMYGAGHGYGDGANYMVRVNGRTLWKKYFNETAADPADAAAHKPPPFQSDSVDLSPYAGQTIVLELAANGHNSGGSDIMRWTEPRLETITK